MSEITYRVSAPTSAARNASIYGIWPLAVIGLGLGLSVAWTCLLGYGLVKLMEFAI